MVAYNTFLEGRHLARAPACVSQTSLDDEILSSPKTLQGAGRCICGMQLQSVLILLME